MAKKKKLELKDRITEFSALGYLAAIFIAQNEEQHALDTVEKMALMLEKDQEIARALDPFLEVACNQLGHKLLTLAVNNEDGGMH